MSGFVLSITAFIVVQLERYWKILAAAGAYRILTWIFDNPLWMAVELKWKFQGAICMMIAAFILNTVVLFIFRNKSTKWILWSALDEFSEKQSEYDSRYEKWGEKKTFTRLSLLIVSYVPFKIAFFLLWCLKKSPRLGDLAAFFVLSIIEDPFVVTMYLRHGYMDGLRVRDAAIYLGSSVISISYWTVRNGLLVEFGLRNLF